MNEVKLHEVRVSAPGKVILHGEHAVVYGKTALAVSLGLRTNIIIKEVDSSDEPSINITLPNVELNEKMELKPIREKLFNPVFLPGITAKFNWMEPDKLDHEKHLANVESCLREIRPNFDGLQSSQQNSLRGLLYMLSGILGSTTLTICSMDISMDSELAAGAGTGSSASFAVCLAGAMIRLIQLKTGSDQPEFSSEDKEIMSAWAYNCERIMHGSPSGIDNMTCTFGSLISFQRDTGARSLPLQLALRVLLVDTGVTRQTSALTGKIAAFRTWNGPAVDHVMDACDHITLTAIRLLENISNIKHDKDAPAQYRPLEALWDMNHCLLGALGVSHPALEEVRKEARAQGFACKLTGAGGGGCAIVLVPPYAQEEHVHALAGALAALGHRVTDTQLGGAGVRVHS